MATENVCCKAMDILFSLSGPYPSFSGSLNHGKLFSGFRNP